jgi:hypothetical protein
MAVSIHEEMRISELDPLNQWCGWFGQGWRSKVKEKLAYWSLAQPCVMNLCLGEGKILLDFTRVFFFLFSLFICFSHFSHMSCTFHQLYVDTWGSSCGRDLSSSFHNHQSLTHLVLCCLRWVFLSFSLVSFLFLFYWARLSFHNHQSLTHLVLCCLSPDLAQQVMSPR